MKHFEDDGDGGLYCSSRLYVEQDGDLHGVTYVKPDGCGDWTIFAGDEDCVRVDLEGVADIETWAEEMQTIEVRIINE
jgi:hypothetical protein